MMAPRTPTPALPDLTDAKLRLLRPFLFWIHRFADTFPWLTIATVESATYVLRETDDGKYLRMLAAGTLTVPPRSSASFRDGTTVHVRSVGGQTEVVQGLGVIVNTAATRKSRTAHSSIMLVHVVNDEWDLLGDLEPL